MAEVMLVRWPEDGDDGFRLAQDGVAVLYLVADDDAPPTPTGCLEDWIRIPGDDRDLRARVAALELRALAHLSPPRVDDDGRFHYRGKVTALLDDEVEIARLLTERFGDVVLDDELRHVAGAAGPEVRARTMQLRARLRDYDVSLRRVRGRGYSLQAR
jgi:DNA-binding response OmpR family regulator